MDSLHTFDAHTSGTKGFVFIGKQLLVYRRDGNTTNNPYKLDLPGGGHEGSETPFETFKRELFEEFGLHVKPADISYVRQYPSASDPSKHGYYLVAHLPENTYQNIQFGDEGTEYFLMAVREFIERDDAWPMMQARARDFIELKALSL